MYVYCNHFYFRFLIYLFFFSSIPLLLFSVEENAIMQLSPEQEAALTYLMNNMAEHKKELQKK